SQRPHEDIEDLLDILPDDRDSPERADERGEIVDLVRAAVARLTLGQREVLTLVDLEECSYAEVSAILAIPIGTVMSRLCRARHQLREDLISLHEPRRTARDTLRRVK
ncbi:MAG: sigma-70 family RNA polymerase sigma factor, partial [Halothiobacillaceae bacterium]|nr:sigma-70 family RNA polymerase sigma factor [Halothiobacillaceae bacterium]